MYVQNLSREYDYPPHGPAKVHLYGLGVTGRFHEVVTTADGLAAYENGAYAQEAFPELTLDDREFLISGLAPGEFDALFGDEE